ncbi:MAG: autotransporter domain-containing protein [Hyphomicrobiaceae bacterium]
MFGRFHEFLLKLVLASVLLTFAGSVDAQTVTQEFDKVQINGGETTTLKITLDNTSGPTDLVVAKLKNEIATLDADQSHFRAVYVENSLSFDSCGAAAAWNEQTEDLEYGELTTVLENITVAARSECIIALTYGARIQFPEDYPENPPLVGSPPPLDLDETFQSRVQLDGRSKGGVASVDVINGAPIITEPGTGADAYVTVTEGDTNITTVKATDPEGMAIRYLLPSHNAGVFGIDVASGELVFLQPPEVVGKPVELNIVVQADDGYGGHDIQTINVTVTRSNFPPVITSDGGGETAAITIAQQTTRVTTVKADDQDGDALTYRLSGVDSGAFTIDASNGVLAFRSPPAMDDPQDDDRDNAYEIIVTVDDGFGGSDTQTIIVTLTEENLPPVITREVDDMTTYVWVLEGGTSVTTVKATDPDHDPISYRTSGGMDESLFTINSSTGELRFLSPQPAKTDFYVVRVEAADGKGGTDWQRFAVAVFERGPNMPTLTISGPEKTEGPFVATFTFSKPVSHFTTTDILVDNGTLFDDFTDTGDGTSYTVTINPIDPGRVTVDVPEGVAKALEGCFPNAAADTLIVDYRPDRERTERTQRIVRNFLSRRADLITLAEPDLVERLRGRSLTRRHSVKLNGTEDNNTFAFATGLQQLLATSRTKTTTNVAELRRSILVEQPAIDSPVGHHGEFDIWVEGTWARAADDQSRSDIGLLYVAAEYRIGVEFAIGILGQMDWTDERDKTDGYDASGAGWLIGPYIAARFDETLFFDARIAKGRANNSVSPYGTYSDDFASERMLAKAQLSGQFDFQDSTIAPELTVIYFEEHQKAYVDAHGSRIGDQNVSLGRLTFGPSFFGSFDIGNGLLFKPHLKVKGIWDFDKDDAVDLETGLPIDSSHDLRARADLRMYVASIKGWEFAADGFYDGIGADGFEAYGGSARMTVPLQRLGSKILDRPIEPHDGHEFDRPLPFRLLDQ